MSDFDPVLLSLRADLRALEDELTRTDQTIARLKRELAAAEKRRDELQPWNPDRGAIAAARRKVEAAEAEAECAHIWATAPVVKFDGRPDGRLLKVTPKQVHVMTTRDGLKVIYDRATGLTRWKFAGRITNLDELVGVSNA